MQNDLRQRTDRKRSNNNKNAVERRQIVEQWARTHTKKMRSRYSSINWIQFVAKHAIAHWRSHRAKWFRWMKLNYCCCLLMLLLLLLVEHESDNIRDEFRRNELIVCRTRNNHRFSVYWSGWIGRVFKVKIYDWSAVLSALIWCIARDAGRWPADTMIASCYLGMHSNIARRCDKSCVANDEKLYSKIANAGPGQAKPVQSMNIRCLNAKQKSQTQSISHNGHHWYIYTFDAHTHKHVQDVLIDKNKPKAIKKNYNKKYIKILSNADVNHRQRRSLIRSYVESTPRTSESETKYFSPS